jgi:uncharacterized protein
MRSLLDVNVLIALLDAGHIHHRRATDWLSGAIEHGWASCPITQNACLRILSQPAYPGHQPVAEVARRLAQATAHSSHAFWGDSLSLLDGANLDWQRVTGHRQVTDLYLLSLAAHNGGRFVTFDERIPLSACPLAGPDQLLVLH